jgi:hypothetical protein
MSVKRRTILQAVAFSPLIGATSGVAYAQVAPLAVGVYRNILASTQYVGAPQNAYFNLGAAYLYTNGAAGVFIDIVPQPTNGGHAGICFNAAPNAANQWQYLSPGPNQPPTQEFWYRGVGVIFLQDGRIQSEQWVVTATGAPGAININTIGYFPANTILRVTSTTNKTTGQTDLAVYSVNSASVVEALLANVSLQAEVIGDRAGVFVIGGGNIQVQPNAIFP